MDEPLREAPAADEWRTNLARSVQDQRRRAREQIDERRQRLKELEERIAGQFDAALRAVQQEAQADNQHTGEDRSRSAVLDERQRALEARAQDLDRRQQASDAAHREAERRHQHLLDDVSKKLADLERRQAELAEEDQRLKVREAAAVRREAELDSLSEQINDRRTTLDHSSADIDRRRAELDTARATHQAEQAKVHDERAELRRLQSDLALAQKSVADRERETQRQRRQIAQQLRAKKQELTAEIELHRAEALASGAGEELQLQMRLSELQGKYERLREDFERREQQRDDATARLAEMKGQLEARQAELARERLALDEAHRKQAELDGVRRELQQQLEERRASQSAVSDGQLQSLEQQVTELQKSHADAQAEWELQRLALEATLAAARKGKGGGADPAEVTRLRDENKQLEAWLAESEEKAKQATSGDGSQEMDDLRRRFEMAVQDVRELKTKNAELSDKLSKSRQAGGQAVVAGGGDGSDWESMKKQLLAQLDSDFDEGDKQEAADKMTVEGAIKITDRVVAEKEQEIQELKRLLESQTQNVGEMAVGAAAIAQMLDGDELVKQERANLLQMQESLREQLKKAEVDISIERAKLARERAELDEKLRTWEAERPVENAPEGTGGSDKGKKGPARGKWLARLGLQGGKDE